MIWFRTAQLAVKSLLLHPMRSALTVLGIFIGVASVIWLLAIGEGISAKAQQQIVSLGADNILVRSVKPASEDLINTSFGPVVYGLKRSDYVRLVATIPTIERALPIREIRREFRHQTHLVDGRLVGCTPQYAEVTRLQVDRGRFLVDTDVRSEKKYCAISAEVAERLFIYEDPLGQTVMVDQDFYTVVGVMKRRNPTAAIGGSFAAQDFANDVYVPITTIWRRIGDLVVNRRPGTFEGEIVELSQVTLKVNDVSQVLQTADVVRNTLEAYHQLPDFGVVVPLELLEQARTTRLMFIVLLGFIAAISLVVGGIGIMNIMLATVTERTREIGIRRALGARRRDIVRQFLAETIALSILGGLLGILGGLTCGPLTGWFRRSVESSFPHVMENLPDLVRTVTPEIIPWSIPLAFGISVVVGVVFGIYPAIRAARMDPIEALRHE